MINVVLGSFFGDEGKGQCVNNLVTSPKCIVVRFSGGSQVGHNVRNGSLRHCFSNFGSGTLKGIPTYWSEYCLVDPYTTALEYKDLMELGGIRPKIIYSPKCQVITPFDVWAQWIDQENREHGTVGCGIWSTIKRVDEGYRLSMIDCLNPIVLREKLKGIQDSYYSGLVGEGSLVTSGRFSIDSWVNAVSYFVKNVRLMRWEDIREEYEDIIFEGSQGILLDQDHGVMPYCTPSYTTSRNAMEIIGTTEEEVIVNYVCRPYITRHGPGPLLTTTRVLDVIDENNRYNEYQKSFRSCEFDIELLKHSLRVDSLYHSGDTRRRIVMSHGMEADDSLVRRIEEETGYEVRRFEYEDWL